MYKIINKKYTKSTRKNKKPFIKWATDKCAMQFVTNCSSGYRRVFEVLRNAFKQYHLVTYSEKTIGQLTNLTERQVRRAIVYFRESGIIRTKQRMNQSLIYTMNPYFLTVFLCITFLVTAKSDWDDLVNRNVRLNELLRKKDIYNVEQRNGCLSTNRKRVLVSRSILKDVASYVTLTEKQIEELENFTDSHIQKALAICKSRTGVQKPVAFLFGTLRNLKAEENGLVNQRPISFTTSFGVKNARFAGQSGSYHKPQDSHKRESSGGFKAVDSSLIADRWKTDSERHLQHKMSRWNAAPRTIQEDLLKNYTSHPEYWSPSWGNPELLLRPAAQPFSFSPKIDQISPLEKLQSELNECIAGITKLSNAAQLYSSQDNQLAIQLATMGIEAMKKRAILLDNQMKQLQGIV